MVFGLPLPFFPLTFPVGTLGDALHSNELQIARLKDSRALKHSFRSSFSLSLRAAPILWISHVMWTVIVPRLRVDPVMLLILAEAMFPLVALVARFIQSFDKDPLPISSSNGSLAVVRWLSAHTDRFEDVTIRNSFISGCENGHLEVAQFLLHRFNLMCPEYLSWAFISFKRSCANGHTTVAKWLAEQFSISTSLVRSENNDVLRDTCFHGHLEVARWLTNLFCLTVDDIRAGNNEVFRESCSKGHLDFAKWLAEEFQLTANDARAENNWALRFSCSYGHLEVAKWLKEHFDLSVEDARSENNYAFRLSCFHGQLEVVSWLIMQFGLTADDARSLSFEDFCECSQYFPVAQLLTQHYGTLWP